MTGRDQKVIQIVCDQLCKVEKCEACPLESFLEKDKAEESTWRLIDANAIHFENSEFDTYSDYSRAFDAIDQAPTIKTFTLADIEEQYRKGLEKGLEEAEPKKCPICGSDLYEYCFMCCYEGEKVTKNEVD